MTSRLWWFSALLMVAANTADAAPHARAAVRTPSKPARAAPPIRGPVTKISQVSAAPPRPESIHIPAHDPVLGRADRVNGREATGVVAFTFDDGPNPETTPAVIDALEKYDVPAAFFVIAQRLTGPYGEQTRALIKRARDGGFLVGSHTVTHHNLRRAKPDELTREIDASVRMLAAYAGPIGLFRAPYGNLNAAGRTRLKRLGLTEVHWSVDPRDWKADDAGALRAKVVSLITQQSGGIVLMHDAKPITAEIITGVLDDLEAENCARLAARREPIVPVSLHYFLKDNKHARPLPTAVRTRTAAYKSALAERCTKRAAPGAAPADAIAAPAPPNAPPID